MEINSKYFSSIEYSENAVVYFPNGLFGFEDCTHYIVIQFDENNDNLFCLQSLNQDSLAFVLLKTGNYLFDYPQYIVDNIENLPSLDNLSIYTICNIRDDIADSTTNLKCPIIINLSNNEGQQVILENSTYPFKYSFSSLSEKKEA